MRSSLLLVVLTLGCGPSTDTKPAGTSADPVLVCERVADVCRIDKSRLGVCVQAQINGAFTCQSQH